MKGEEKKGVAADAAALAPYGLSRFASQAKPPAANARHTPGPWTVERNAFHSAYHWVRSFHPRHICKVEQDQLEMGDGSVVDVGLGNAHLIAAAPELLKDGGTYQVLADTLIQTLVEQFADDLDEMDRIAINQWSHASQKFVAAIAKATGQ